MLGTKPDFGSKADVPADAGNTPGRAPTLGERRVRLGFNPSQNSDVDTIKSVAAAAIDFCEAQRGDPENPNSPRDPEKERLLSLAQTHFEDAAMWAVKAVTG